MKTNLFICKTAIIFTLLLHINSVCLLSQNCNYTWVQQQSGTTAILHSVKAVNELICWTAGTNGTVRRTTDGGATWLNANLNPGIINGNITNIDAVDASNAWVTTSITTNTFIYKTTNSGNNWVQVYSQTGGFIHGINMISSANGFAFGDPIANTWRILVTTDGGFNWLPHPLAPSAQAGESGFENCFQVSLPYMWFGASIGSIYRTTNNGVNWTSHPTPGINSYVFAIHFNSLVLGLAAALSMVKSTDAGATYTPLPALGLGNINGIEGSGNDFWYIRGSSTYRSTNGGENWTLVYDAGNTQLHIDFPNNLSGCLMGWAVGYTGLISKMTGTPVGTANNNNEIPKEFALEQNYPNPFNPITKIIFALPPSPAGEGLGVRVAVYDILGREVQTLVNEKLKSGVYEITFDASNLSSGVYYYKLNVVETTRRVVFTDTKKMVVVK